MPRDDTSVLVLRLLKTVSPTPSEVGPLYIARIPGVDRFRVLLIAPGGVVPTSGRSLSPAPGERVLPRTPETLAARGAILTRPAVRELLREVASVYAA